MNDFMNIRAGAEIFRRPRDTAPMAFSGERLTSAIGGQVEIEHLHRYFLARTLCAGLDVLDIACGEGYGTALLAQVARHVTGADADGPAVAQARAVFGAPNVTFTEADAQALPFADASFDAVVSFETIEHFSGHERFIAEIKRVLRPRGRLIASSPDRDFYAGPGSQPNPFHVRELTRDEFTGLLGAHFAHVATLVQRPLTGSVMMPDRAGAPSVPAVFEKRGDDLVRGCRGLPHAMYVICAASDEPVSLPPSLYIESSDLDGRTAQLAQARADADAARAALAEAQATWRGEEASLRAAIAALQTEISSLHREAESRAASHATALAALHEEAEARCAALQAAWQNAESRAASHATALAALHEEAEARCAALQAAWQNSESAARAQQASDAHARAQLEAEIAGERLRAAQREAGLADRLAHAQAETRAAAADGQKLRADLAQAAAALVQAQSQAADAHSALTGRLARAQQDVASAELRLRAVEGSTSWKATWPLRRAASRLPWAGVCVRFCAKAVWWSLTGQMPQRFRWWRANRRRPKRTPPAPPLLPSPPTPATIALPFHEAPLVCVIIPGYGQVEYTRKCLASIARHLPAVPFEVLVAEDASGDPAVAGLRGIANLRLVEHPRNLGFLLSCNAASRLTRAAFLMFLNNDTEVQEGWLDTLVDLLRCRPEAGAAGSKLIYPDGRLQEAGGIIWDDASGWNYGRLDDPGKPVYNYVRETDYVSGAALLVRAALFHALGGFDPAYAPAYCEDSDLAFRLRDAGHSVLYQPRSVVVHHEGVTHGTDVAQGLKAYQTINQARLRDRWQSVLRAAHYPNATQVMRARDRAGPDRRVVLVIDHYVPEPDRDAGSRTIRAFISALQASGRIVKFWTDNAAYSPGYTEALQDDGVEVLYGPETGGFAAWIAENGAGLTGVLVSRPHVAPNYMPLLRRHTRARIAYYGHDLHAARMRLMAAHQQAGDPAAIAGMERLEEDAWRQADVVLYPSEEEAAYVRDQVRGVSARAVTPYAFTRFADAKSPPAGHTILFVAGFAHPPNEDAACWLVAEIWPQILRMVPGASLHIVGSNPTAKVRGLAGDQVRVRPNVPDAELALCYETARVAVVPLRYGAGVKMKVAEALANGVPLVTTPVGAQGCPGLGEVITVTDDAALFATSAARLLCDDVAWREASARQVVYARAHFTPARLAESLLTASGL